MGLIHYKCNNCAIINETIPLFCVQIALICVSKPLQIKLFHQAIMLNLLSSNLTRACSWLPLLHHLHSNYMLFLLSLSASLPPSPLPPSLHLLPSSFLSLTLFPLPSPINFSLSPFPLSQSISPPPSFIHLPPSHSNTHAHIHVPLLNKDARSKSKITVDGKCKLLLIREETGGPSKQLCQWADILLLVFSYADDDSLAQVYYVRTYQSSQHRGLVGGCGLGVVCDQINWFPSHIKVNPTMKAWRTSYERGLGEHCVHVEIIKFTVCIVYCWPLPSNQSFYQQIPGCQGGVGDHSIGQRWEEVIGQQNSCKTLIAVHSTMYLMHPN